MLTKIIVVLINSFPSKKDFIIPYYSYQIAIMFANQNYLIIKVY